MTHKAFAAGVVALAGCFGSVGAAEENAPKGADPSSPVWASICIRDNAKRLLGCRLVQQIFVKKGEQRALLIAAQMRYPVGGVPYFFFRLPVGLDLPAGVTIGVFKEGAKEPAVAARGAIQTCDRQGCAATVHVSEDFLTVLASGQSLSVDFRAVSGEPIRVGLGLQGFARESEVVRARVAARD